MQSAYDYVCSFNNMYKFQCYIVEEHLSSFWQI